MASPLPSWETIRRYRAQVDANRWYSSYGPLVCEFDRWLAECFGGDAATVPTCANATLMKNSDAQVLTTNGSNACLCPPVLLSQQLSGFRSGMEPGIRGCRPH
jgi:hypothetical protein